jgi:perosamine synthetase
MVQGQAGRMIRLMVPDIEEAEIEAVTAVLRGGYLVQGDRVREFELKLAETVGVRHVVAVSSGTAALHLAITALGIGPGDSVAVPAYTWPATANVIALVGADPVFVDIEPATYGIDPVALGRALARHNRIKAIMPVHAFGQFADMESISKISKVHGVPIVEDAACALGASLAGRAAGAWGQLGCLSFHPRKVLTTGEGGAVTTDDDSLARHVRTLRNHGQDPNASFPDFIMPGYNLRLTEFQAALGAGQLRRLDVILAQRRRLAGVYAAIFSGTDIESPRAGEPGSHIFQSYVVLLPKRHRESRSSIIRSLKVEGIETTVGTYHVPLTTYFRTRDGYRIGDFPVTDDISGRALTLPLHGHLDERDAQRVGEALIAKIA